MKTIISISGKMPFPSSEEIVDGLIKSGFKKNELNQDLTVNTSRGLAKFSAQSDSPIDVEVFNRIAQNVGNVRKVLVMAHGSDLRFEIHFDTNL